MTRTRRHSWGAQLGSGVVLSALLLLIPVLSTEGADLSRIQRPVKKPIPVAFSKFSGPVYKAYQRSQAGLKGAALAASVMSPQDISADSIRVVFELSRKATSSDSAEVVNRGGRVEVMAENLIQAWLPRRHLADFNDIRATRHIRFPYRPQPLDTLSEGLAVIDAVACRDGTAGQGVKVAVLDLGFEGFTSLLGTELPSSVVTRSFRSDGDILAGTNHGTACAEIVHDIVPNAQMYLINSGTVAEFYAAVEYIVTEGIDVVNFSAGWEGVFPVDGTSAVSQKVNWAVSTGVVWCGAAGNEAEEHWSGPFTDTDHNNSHEFADSDQFNFISLDAGQEVFISLSWDDWPETSQDYDLWLLSNSPPALVDISNDIQDGDDSPREMIRYQAPVSGLYAIVIIRNSGSASPRMHLHTKGAILEHQTAGYSLVVPADAASSLTSGAVDYLFPSTIESYSSQGPTDDGRTKPDLVAPDYVSTVSKGRRGFQGTSAASPHTAGVAALVVSQYPALSPQQVMDSLKTWAIDKGNAGRDNVFGWGLLQANCEQPEYRISGAWWTEEVDNDGDGYVQAARLSWNPDVQGCSGSLSVFEKIYWKRADSSSWILFTTTSTHAIDGCDGADTRNVGVSNGSHNLYDWKIEGYRDGQSSPDVILDPSTDADLDDVKMETAEEDVPSYLISGYVRGAGGGGIADAIISGLPGDPQTDASGYYGVSVEHGWSGTVTPTHQCYTFSPISRTYSNVSSSQINQEYTGNLKTFQISGNVQMGGGGPLAGVMMIGLPGNPSTDVSGNYTATVDCGWSGTVAPSHLCYTFSPASRIYTDENSSEINEDYTATIRTYRVSGYVRTGTGAGISGAVMSGLPGTPSTNASGYYSATVDCGWSGTATPAKDCYTFNPPALSFSNVTSAQTGDVTATLETFTISGRILNRLGNGVSGIRMTGFPTGLTTDAAGSYQGTVDCGWSGTVQPSLPLATFDPSQKSYSDLHGTVSAQDYTVNQTPQMALYPPVTIAEGDPYSLIIQASDPDGESPTLTATGVPLNASFGDNGDGSASFEFTPQYDQAGTYLVTFTASDGALTARTSLEILVTNTNRPPADFSLLAPGTNQLLRATTVELIWRATSDPDPNEDVVYWVFVQEGLSADLPDSIPAASDTATTLSDLIEEATYSWRVIARDTTGGETINSGGWRPFSVDDLTPPELFFGMILSPILPFSVDLVVKPSEELVAPVTAGVTIGATHDTVKLDHRIESSDGDLFSARYGFTSDGSGIIVLRGSDLSSNEAVDTIPFSGYRVATGASLAGISYDQSLSVRRARGSNASPTLVISYPAVDAVPFERVGWRPLGAPCLFASADRSDGSPLELRFSPQREIGSGDLSNIVLFQLREGQWEPLQTWRSDRNGDFVAYPDDLGVFLAAAGPVDSDLQAELLPRTHVLRQNVPNPFNPGTTIAFEIGEGRNGLAHSVRLDLFNMLGQRVRRLLDETLTPGHHSVAWNGADDAGSRLPSGVYFARLTVENEISTIKMVLMK